MRSKAFPLLLLACAALTPAIASAFNFRFLRHTVLQQLTPEDIQIGSLAAVDVDDRRGCRRTRLAVTAGGQTGSGTYLLCKVRSGEWNFYTPRPGATLTPSQPDSAAPANAT